jgi:1,4-alpha-glucan branching enzyme
MGLQKQFLKSKKSYKVTFSLPKEAAKGAKEVKLLGDFNNWEKNQGIPMKFKNGKFTASMNFRSGEEHQFRYLLDNERWVNDWKADKYVPTPFGVDNSVVVAADEVKSIVE